MEDEGPEVKADRQTLSFMIHPSSFILINLFALCVLCGKSKT